MTDKPDNAIDQPFESPEGFPGQGDGGQPDVGTESAGEAGAPAEHPTAETAAHPTPETPAEPAPAEPEADPGQAAERPLEAAAETPAEEPAAQTPIQPAEADADEGQPTEAEVDEGQPAEGEPGQPPDEEPKSENMDWYILKVQSNREESIREGLMRRVAIAGLGRCFGQVIVPTEQVTEFKGGKKRVMKRKLYPGYLVVQMEINDDTWFLVRETPGIGDFTGAAGHPTPMLPHEVSRILARQEEKTEKAPKLKIGFRPGDQVKINEGTFENFEGQVESIDQTNGQVTVMINIFGRSTPVTLEYWQVESI